MARKPDWEGNSEHPFTTVGAKLWLTVCVIVCLPVVLWVFEAFVNATGFEDLIGRVTWAAMVWFGLGWWLFLHLLPPLMLAAAIVVTYRMLTDHRREWDEAGMRVGMPVLGWLLAAGTTASCWWILTSTCERMLSKGPMCVVVDAIASR